MEYKIMLLMFGILLLISPVMAVSNIVYEQRTDIDVIIPCKLGGDICSTTAFCNLSVQYRNGTYMVDFQATENLGTGDFKYELDSDQTYYTGAHQSKMVCWDGIYNGTEIFTITFTPTGEEINTGQGITSVGIIIAMMFLSCLFAFYGNKFSQSDKALYPIGLFFLLMSIMMGAFVCSLSYIASRDILFPLATEGLQFQILFGLMWGLLAMAMFALLYLIFKVIKEIKVGKSLVKNSDGYPSNKL